MCLSEAQLAAVAAGEGDDAHFTHVAACEACSASAEEQSGIRTMLAPLRVKPITGTRRAELAAVVLASAEYPMTATAPWKIIGGVVAAGVLAAAATVALLAKRAEAPASQELATTTPVVAPVPAPEPVVSDAALVDPIATATVISRVRRDHRDIVDFTDGEIRVDARDHRMPVDIVASGATLAVADASVRVRAVRGVIVEVVVIAGTVELAEPGGRIRIETGDVWTRPVAPASVTIRPAKPPVPAPAPPALDHGMGAFRAGWTALRANDFAAAIAAFDRASDPVIVEDASYWAAIAAQRSGDHAGARGRLEVFVDRFPNSPRIDDAKAQIERLK